MKNKVHYNKPCESIGLTCCLCRAVAKGIEKEIGVCTLYKTAILKRLLAALRLKALSVTVLYVCTVSMEWNNYRKYKISCFQCDSGVNVDEFRDCNVIPKALKMDTVSIFEIPTIQLLSMRFYR
jgi:hypothetical protein